MRSPFPKLGYLNASRSIPVPFAGKMTIFLSATLEKHRAEFRRHLLMTPERFVSNPGDNWKHRAAFEGHLQENEATPERQTRWLNTRKSHTSFGLRKCLRCAGLTSRLGPMLHFTPLTVKEKKKCITHKYQESKERVKCCIDLSSTARSLRDPSRSLFYFPTIADNDFIVGGLKDSQPFSMVHKRRTRYNITTWRSIKYTSSRRESHYFAIIGWGGVYIFAHGALHLDSFAAAAETETGPPTP